MCAPSFAAALALVAASAADRGDVRWIVGPGAVELDGGRVTCALPAGLALAPGAAARPIVDALADGADGSVLAVVSPTSPADTWFVVVAWREGASAEETPETSGPTREGGFVWLERPRRDDRTGRIRWAFAGRTSEGPTVNQHVRVPASGGAVEVTLVTPVEELAAARAQLERIVEGLGAGTPDGAPARRK